MVIIYDLFPSTTKQQKIPIPVRLEVNYESILDFLKNQSIRHQNGHNVFSKLLHERKGNDNIDIESLYTDSSIQISLFLFLFL